MELDFNRRYGRTINLPPRVLGARIARQRNLTAQHSDARSPLVLPGGSTASRPFSGPEAEMAIFASATASQSGGCNMVPRLFAPPAAWYLFVLRVEEARRVAGERVLGSSRPISPSPTNSEVAVRSRRLC